jgi:hypothetical protein
VLTQSGGGGGPIFPSGGGGDRGGGSNSVAALVRDVERLVVAGEALQPLRSSTERYLWLALDALDVGLAEQLVRQLEGSCGVQLADLRHKIGSRNVLHMLATRTGYWWVACAGMQARRPAGRGRAGRPKPVGAVSASQPSWGMYCSQFPKQS